MVDGKRARPTTTNLGSRDLEQVRGGGPAQYFQEGGSRLYVARALEPSGGDGKTTQLAAAVTPGS